MTKPDADDVASPVCYADEADDLYMGFASKAELAALRDELAAAERAGDRAAVVRRLGEILPRVRDAALHAELKKMLTSYQGSKT